MTKFRFCPFCGTKLKPKMLDHKRRLACTRCDFVHYGNSKPCAGALVIKNREVLMVKRARAPRIATWDFPGGFLEEGEEPEVGLKRELMEELGVRCKILSFFGAFVDEYGETGEAILSLYYVIKPLNAIRGAADDISEYAYFPISNLPKQLAFDSTKQILQRLRYERRKV